MECPHIPITTYGEFSKRLHDKVVSQRIPITGSIEVTARCNLRCAHCYINLPAGDRQAQERELTYRELCDILDQIVDEGCLWLLLTGGEPFVRPDFLDIYTYAKKKGLLTSLFTNGITITPRIADYLAEWCPFSVEITLYGYTQEVYERVTGVPGSYEHCMRGIELLLERDIPLRLKTSLLTLNKHEVGDMQAYAEGLGVQYRFDPVLSMRIDGSRQPAQYRLSPQEVVELDLADEKRIKAWRELWDRLGGPPAQLEYLYQCGAGIGSFHIDPYGQLSVCMMSRVPSYDLLRGTFHEGWHDFLGQVRAQKWSADADCPQYDTSPWESPCQSCELIALCGQCPGWAQMESGEPEKPVEYLCQIAHLRAEALGLNSSKTGGKR